eukprot:CAMPEP_0172718820 /NCGR_PEP_ID=MMETSP1074-20121228/75146_1 /TAXON_ID=2916 /ORGANISM="Ceratium fusus, Strain PA161109" /LENGTH=258 /DNA_ID=CAMNT_0013544095 /DNA_START=456 /DNA_END=1229 /DNA_ORIENTATION=-
MESSGPGVRAVRMPLLERPCELRPVPRATNGDVQPLNPAALRQSVDLLTAWDLVNALKVHAPCSKLVFAILAEVCMVSIVNRQSCLAIGQVCQKLAECQTREDLQASMEAHPYILAIFHEHTVLSDDLPAYNLAKALRDEDSARVSLDNPRETLPVGVCLDCSPHVEEQRQVHIVLRVWPSNASWEINLHKTARRGVEHDINITEHHPTLACKDMCLQQLSLHNEVGVKALLLPTGVTDGHGKAKKRCPVESTKFHRW